MDFNEFSFNPKKLPTVKFGDYNLDGYVDLLVVVERLVDKKDIAVLLHNVPCGSDQCAVFSRTFKIDVNANNLETSNSVETASFFDLFDDVN